MRRYEAMLALATIATACAARHPNASVVPSNVSDGTAPRVVVYQQYNANVASDRRASVVTAIGALGTDASPSAHTVTLSFPPGRLLEDWPAAEISRGSARWSLRFTDASSCADEAEWPDEHSATCRTEDGECVASDLERWRVGSACAETADGATPAVLARMRGVRVADSVPRLTSISGEWAVAVAGERSTDSPVVLIDGAPSAAQTASYRYRILEGRDEHALDRATEVTRTAASDRFAAYFAAHGIGSDAARIAADHAMPLEDRLVPSDVVLVVPILAGEMQRMATTDLGDLESTTERVGVVRWIVDAGGNDANTFVEAWSDRPSDDDRIVTNVELLVRACARSFARSAQRLRGRMVVIVAPAPVDTTRCQDEWDADTDGDGVTDDDEDECAGVTVTVEESALRGPDVSTCLGHVGEAVWNEPPTEPRRVYVRAF